MRVRPLGPGDLAAVLDLEQRAMPDAWSEGMLATEIRVTGGLALLAEHEGQMLGYAFFRVCLPECELLRLVVDPEQRRQGTGRLLLGHGLAQLAMQGSATCFLEVRASNQPALRLYEAEGFFKAGRRKGYYSQPKEDALQLCKHLTKGGEGSHENITGY